MTTTHGCPTSTRRTGFRPSQLPGSLRDAISSFVLTCAARRARGQVNNHNSMLVHVTRFQAVQSHVAEQIGDQLRLLRDRIRYGDRNARIPVEEELRALWERDFVPAPAHGSPPTRSARSAGREVWDQVRAAVEKIQVRIVNGTSRDALEYYEHRRDGPIRHRGRREQAVPRADPRRDSASATTCRASKTYDTLLQMGRWFGYRPGYEDLCRLYTTTALRDAYAEITAANDELRREFEEMAALDAKPENFGLRVRASPAGLAVTAANKMRRGLKVKLSYSGDIPETVIFDLA